MYCWLLQKHLLSIHAEPTYQHYSASWEDRQWASERSDFWSTCRLLRLWRFALLQNWIQEDWAGCQSIQPRFDDLQEVFSDDDRGLDWWIFLCPNRFITLVLKERSECHRDDQEDQPAYNRGQKADYGPIKGDRCSYPAAWSTLKVGLTAKYVMFDTWFSNPY